MLVLLLALVVQGPEQPDLSSLPVLRSGETIEGEIADGDRMIETENLDRNYAQATTVGKTYRFEVLKPGPFHVELRSYFFDAYLVLRNAKRELIAEDDDGWIGTHSRTTALTLEAGTYLIDACALHGERGPFELALKSGKPANVSAADRARLEIDDSERRVATIEREVGVESAKLADALIQLGNALQRGGAYEAARGHHERAHAIRERALGAEHPDTVTALNKLAVVLWHERDLDRAHQLFERVLELTEKSRGPDHSSTADALSNLAIVIKAKGDLASALPLFERVLSITEKNHGSEHRLTAASLVNLGEMLRTQGKPLAAQPLYERALTILEKILGPEHASVAGCLNNLAAVHWDLGDYDAARALLERALAIREKSFGTEHPETAEALNNLAELYSSEGDHAAARRLHERALRIREETLGVGHPLVATSLDNLARVLISTGDLTTSPGLLERSLSIREGVFGPRHSEVAGSLGSLADLLRSRGQYADARRMLQRALQISEASLGADHPRTLVLVSNLAFVLVDLREFESARTLLERALDTTVRVHGERHWKVGAALRNSGRLSEIQGDYEDARILYERSLVIQEAALGPEHPEVASSLGSLAAALRAQGDFTAAAPLFERALVIREGLFGREHPETARALNNLAVLAMDQGDLPTARRLCSRSLKIREVLGLENPETAQAMLNLAEVLRLQHDTSARALYERALDVMDASLGVDHPSTADYMMGLALQLRSEGELDQARSLLERALEVQERALGPDHPYVAYCLTGLGVLLEDQGDLPQARHFLERAVGAYEQALGTKHPQRARSLNSLAHVLRGLQDFAGARELYERAYSVLEEVLGPEHPQTATSLHNLATALADAGQSRRAWDLVQGARSDRRDWLERTLESMSEGERYAYLAGLIWHLELQISLARILDEPGLKVEAYEALLAWKGWIGRLLTASRERLAARAHGEHRELLERLRKCQMQLSRVAFCTDVPDRAVHERYLGELKDERSRLERELQDLLGSAETPDSVGFEALRSSLSPGSALIDFFVHSTFEPVNGSAGGWRPDQLTAWITRGDRHEPIELELGPAADVERAVVARLESLQQDGQPIAMRGLPIDPAENAASAGELRRLLWEPLTEHLEGVSTILVAPDSFLSAFPFEILVLEDGTLLVEHFSVVYVQDASSLAQQPLAPNESDSLLVVGHVDFGDPEERATTGIAPAQEASTLRRSFEAAWPRLPATEHEARVVADLHERALGEDHGRLVLQESEPTEERLKRELPQHSIVHLATHGFFNPEGLPSMWEAAKDDAGKAHARMSDEARHLVGKHAGLLSGLVCAGASSGGDPDGDDGYLTAEELGWLDLSAVELVVLSACETGLGRAESGEGLIGLRRAFHTGGVKTVISSLWSVQDASTAKLMQDFYTNLWVKKMGRLESLRQAQLEMLKKNRGEYGDPMPATWGAFVLSGEWR